MARKVNSVAEYEELLSQSPRAVIAFIAEWCPASETAVGRFESFAEGKSPICFATVDVNSNIVCKHFPFTSNILIHKRYSPFSATQRLAHKEEVRGLPTFVFYQGGEKVDEICGGNVDALESRLAAFAQ